MTARPIATLLLTAFAVSVTAPAHAALVQLCGTTVCYEYDDNQSANPGIVRIGSPTLLGNSNVLKFTPTTLNVLTSGPGGAADLSWSFQFTRVWSPQGLEIGPINLLLAGDYQILGGGTVSADFALSAVDDVDDAGLQGFPESADWMGSFSESMATGLPFRNFDLTGSVNPADTFTDLATSVSLTLSGHLSVTAGGAADAAFIAQKLGLLAGATVVPAPGAAWLLTTGLVALLHRARRRARR